jgi:hypothetical protein
MYVQRRVPSSPASHYRRGARQQSRTGNSWRMKLGKWQARAGTLAIAAWIGMSLVACGASSQRPDKSPMQRRIDAMFTKADKDGDEWLTPAELQAGFPWLAGKSAEIDTDDNGKVSLAEISSHIELQSMQPPPKKKKRD